MACSTRPPSEILCQGFVGTGFGQGKEVRFESETTSWFNAIWGPETVYAAMSREGINYFIKELREGSNFGTYIMQSVYKDITKLHIYEINSFGLRCYVPQIEFKDIFDSFCSTENSILVSHDFHHTNNQQMKGKRSDTRYLRNNAYYQEHRRHPSLEKENQGFPPARYCNTYYLERAKYARVREGDQKFKSMRQCNIYYENCAQHTGEVIVKGPILPNRIIHKESVILQR